MKKFFIIFLIICLTVTISSKTLEKYISNKSETVILLTQNLKGDKNTVVLKSPLLGWASLNGILSVDQSGDITLEVNSISYLANWANGWTKGEHDAYGKIFLKKIGNYYKCSIIDKIEIFEIKSGSIKYFEDYYLDDSGVKKVKDRIDRILELVKFLKTKDFTNIYGSPKFKTAYGESFKKSTKVFLFPETKNFNELLISKKLPSEYYEEIKDEETKADEKNIKKFQFGYGYFWNKEYSKKIFPKNLVELRNSGSLWRDYEEALQIIFTFYNLDYYFNEILNNSEFKKVK